MKALVKVGYGCNNHCTFCHTYDVRHIDAEADEIDRGWFTGNETVAITAGANSAGGHGVPKRLSTIPDSNPSTSAARSRI